MKVVKVDVERNTHLADRFGIRKIPTLILFEAGEEKARLVEVTRRPAVEAGLADAIGDAVTDEPQ